MKNTIYNAIQKQLVIDDNDSSIQYTKSDIINAIQFNVDNIDQLYQYFKQYSQNIFCYNTKGCVTLIMKNDVEIPLCQADKSDKPLFIKITDETLLKGNDLLIPINHKQREPMICQWSNSIYMLQSREYLKSDDNLYDGYLNCKLILDKLKSNECYKDCKVNAIDYCRRKFINGNKLNYQGYLPAIEQLKVICKYMDMINYILEFFKAKPIPMDRSSMHFWSSSELYQVYNQSAYVCLTYKSGNDIGFSEQTREKIKNAFAMPVFHKIYSGKLI